MKKTEFNILFFETSSGYGGSAVCLYNILRYLDREKITPFVAVLSEGPNIERIRDLGVEVFSLKRGWLVFSLLKIIRQKKIDLVYNNNELYSNTPGIWAAKLARVPCLCHLRRIRKFTRLERFSAGLVDKFITVSNACKDGLLKEGVLESKITVIYDGVEIPGRIENAKEEIATVGMVSRIVEQKGHEVFVLAAKRLKEKGFDLKYLIFGDDPKENQPTKGKLLKLIADEKFADVIQLMGWHTDLNTIYTAMDIAVCPSLMDESFGMNVAEAMAFGKIVVASRLGAYTELIDEDKNGLLFNPGAPDDLARKIEILLKDPARRKEMARRAYESAKGRFNVQENVKKIEKVIYETLCR